MECITAKEFVEACHGDFDIDFGVRRVTQLLADGADVNAIHKGSTGLIEAIECYQHKIVETLLACPDIDVNIRCSSGNTALGMAVLYENTVAVSNILSREDTKLDSIEYETEETALHYACVDNGDNNYNEEYVHMILAHPGCTKDLIIMKNKEGKTAEQCAEANSYHGCVRLIREYLAYHEDVGRICPLLSLIPECPACLKKMKPPIRVYTCGNGHVICFPCITRVNQTENMCVSRCGSMYTGRATTVEQMIREIVGTMVAEKSA